MSKKIYEVTKRTKEGYIEAINVACDDLKSRLEDIFVDMEKSLKEVNINIKIEPGCISTLSINKEYNIEKEEEGDDIDE